ncbi:UNVERIFIED_CONTAM: putative ATP synthase protein YMF19, partial [Sesamum indicum]
MAIAWIRVDTLNGKPVVLFNQSSEPIGPKGLSSAKGKTLANSAKGTKQSRKLQFSSSESDVRSRHFFFKVTRNFVREEEECPKTPMLSVRQQPTAALVSFFTTRTDLTELSCLEGIIDSQSIMPQLDKFTYFTQFFWSCLFLFTFYIAICNNGDGTNIRSNDSKSLEDILRKGFSTGVSYMYSSLFEVSQWCNAVDLLGKRKKITLISCFGELSGSRGMERNIFYLISKSSYSTSSNPGWGITCRNDIMLMH